MQRKSDECADKGQPGSVRSVHEHEYVDGAEVEQGQKHPNGPSLKLLDLVGRKVLEALL